MEKNLSKKMTDFDSMNINDLTEDEIVGRMRKCNYEKYKSLVRMHLSFQLDLNIDDFDLPCQEIVYEDKGKIKKWNRILKKHKTNVVATATTACSSTKSANNSPTGSLSQQIDPGFWFHLKELKSFLMHEKIIKTEGIFRKNGSVARQNELRLRIQNESPLELETSNFSAHDCATVFKGYLAELTEPVLTDAHYPAHLQIAPLCLTSTPMNRQTMRPQNPDHLKREQQLLNSIQLLLLLLPEENRQLMQHIIEILHAIVQYADINLMSGTNLATMFAPHLICPRNLPPEALHYVVTQMSCIITYMISKGMDIFNIPATLSTDIRAYFLDRKRKKTMSPEQTLDESISDVSTVNTVYTFIDREKTAAAHTTNTTDTELAQLYAHIQTLPESSKKRRLIKQFNKQNGQGTPLQLVVMNRLKNSEGTRSAKSFGDSIKKHIFHKGIISRTPKRTQASTLPLGMQTPNGTQAKNPKLRALFQSPVTLTPTARPTTSTFPTSTITSATPISSTTSANTLPTTSTFLSFGMNTNINHNKNSLKKSQSTTSIRSITSITKPKSCLIDSSDIQSNTSSNSSHDNPTYKTQSAPVSRQCSADNQMNFLACSSSSSNSVQSLNQIETNVAANSSRLQQILGEHNCCSSPFKLISEAAKHLIYSNEKKMMDDNLSNPSTPINSKELKSRYRSEPNLSRICLRERLIDVPTTVYEKPIEKMVKKQVVDNVGKGFKRQLIKGVSMNNLKLSYHTPVMSRRLVRSVSSTLKECADEEDYKYSGDIKQKVEPLLEDINDNDDVDDVDLDDETFEENSNDQLDSSIDDDNNNDDDDENDVDDGVEEFEDEKEDDKDKVDGCVATTNATTGGGSNSSNELPGCTERVYKQMLMQHTNIYRNLDLLTSTPAGRLGRRSMSPITKSTQRMPKAMQESIMTPRSRKPVMVSTTGLSDPNQTICQTDLSSFREQDEDSLDNTMPEEKQLPHNENANSMDTYSDILRRQHLLQVNQNFLQINNEDGRVSCSNSNSSDKTTKATTTTSTITTNDALTNNFKEYLLKRSVLTASPVDSSFSSQPDDFNDTNQDIEDLDESQLSPSLLYCLDGNQPQIEDSKTIDNNDHDDENVNEKLTTITNLSIYNNARKRAASVDTEQIHKTNMIGDYTATNSVDKENIDDYIITKKLMISEDSYPGETSF